MTWVANKLNQRIQICSAKIVPDDSPELSHQEFTLIKEVWAELIPVSSYIKAIRAQNATDNIVETHFFRIRKSSTTSISIGFTSGFSSGFDSTSKHNPIKADYFIKLLRSSAYRLYRVLGTQADDQNKEFIFIKTMEIEEDR